MAETTTQEAEVEEDLLKVPRILLALTAWPFALVGIWATLLPRSFYDTFPGLGRHWIDVDGPYNEHLVRDVGHLELAVAFVLVAAIVLGTRRLLQIGAIAALISGLPHVTYHALNRDGYDTLDQVASISGLALGVIFPFVVLFLTMRPQAPQAPTVPSASPPP
jgi:hypothetical protein